MLVCKHLETKVKCGFFLFLLEKTFISSVTQLCLLLTPCKLPLIMAYDSNHSWEAALGTLSNELIYAQHLEQCLAQSAESGDGGGGCYTGRNKPKSMRVLGR